MLCVACDCLYINGLKCHENGCPEAWRDLKRKCLWCGSVFLPETKDQAFCTEDCWEAYQ